MIWMCFRLNQNIHVIFMFGEVSMIMDLSVILRSGSSLLPVPFISSLCKGFVRPRILQRYIMSELICT